MVSARDAAWLRGPSAAAACRRTPLQGSEEPGESRSVGVAAGALCVQALPAESWHRSSITIIESSA